MARVGILTCSNATQDLGCSSVVCLADLRKRKGFFASYPQEERLDLVGLMNCPGCPTLAGYDKLLQRIRGLTEFRVQAVHLSNCIKYLCPFKEKYLRVLQEAFPQVQFILGTHAEEGNPAAFRELVQGLFSQPRKSMVDLILKR
ncbi:MAG: CGGC domain-containing protein [Desulfobaccales bacterium]